MGRGPALNGRGREALSSAFAVAASVAVLASLAMMYGPPPVAASAFWWSLPSFLCAAPFVAVCVLVSLARTRSFGLAFATWVGLTALPLVVVSAFFSLGWTGFSTGTRALLVLLLSCLVLIVAGITGWKALPRERRNGVHWVAAPLLAFVSAGLAWGATQWAGVQVRRHADAVVASDREMEAAMRRFAECRRAASEACALPASSAYRVFEVAAAMVCAEPKGGGLRAFVVGPDGRLHATPQPASREEGTARCVEALPVGEEGALRVLFCAARQRTATGAWPDDLEAVVAAEPGCVPAPSGKLFYTSAERSIAYFRGRSGADVTVVSRAAHFGRRYADSSGRAFAFDSELPPSLSAKARPSPAPRPERPSPQTVEPACAAGDAEACWALGDDTFSGTRGRTADRARGREIWDKACRSGGGRACYELGSRGRYDPPKGAVLGEEEGLRRTRSSLADYERACDLGEGAGCAEAGRILIRGQEIPADVLARARFRLGKACDLGDDQACRDLVRTGASPLVVEDLCGRGLAEACVVLAKTLAAPGPQRDDARARDLFLLACDYWPSPACLEAARLAPEHAAELTARAAAPR